MSAYPLSPQNPDPMKNLAVFFAAILLAVSCDRSAAVAERHDDRQNPIMAGTISNQTVNAFAEDAQGHIWIATFRGLNKYDSRDFYQYFCTDDNSGLPDNNIKDIYLDSQNRLWIATVNGVCQYTEQDDFRRIPIDYDNKNGYEFVESLDGRIFLNTVLQLYAYDPANGCFECVIPDFDPGRTFNVRCHIDRSDNLWAADYSCLRCYDPTTVELVESIPLEGYPTYSYLQGNGHLWLTGSRTISIFDTVTRHFVEVPDLLSSHPVLREARIDYIHPYGNDGLLLNTARHGMFYYDFVEGTVVHQDQTGFPFEAPKCKINRIFTDSHKNLWIGSVDQGYTVRYNYKAQFNSDNYLRSCMENKSVTALAVDKSDHLWISTLTDGMYMYDLSDRRIEKVELPELPWHVDSKRSVVDYIFADDEDNLWIIVDNYLTVKCVYRKTYGGGNLHVEAVYPMHFPRFITQDRNKTVWVASGSQYLYSLRKGETEFKPMQAFDQLFCFIPHMLPLDDGKLLVAAFNSPLKSVDPDSFEVAEAAVSDEDMKNCIRRSAFIPTVMYEDTYGDVWIGTITNGLLLYSASDNTLRPVPGAPCSDISSIEEDLQGNIWVGTLYGLGKYDRSTGRFTNYSIANGIGGNQFYERASCRLPDGTLVFGGTHGLTFFNPLDVRAKRSVPLLFEKLKIHNQEVRPDRGECIDKHLSHVSEIRLSSEQNSFSISFAALDFCEYDRVAYCYKMENYDDFWIDANNVREANYAHLPAGRYTFRVRAMNGDRNIVEAENSIDIRIDPSPWVSWWAIGLYLLTTFTVAGLFLRQRMRIRAEKAASLQERMEKEQERRINRMNMSFFANVSHEFRTPLTMIAGPIGQLSESPDIGGENRRLLHIVRRSVDRMLGLVNQLLDFNKLENDTLRLRVRRTDIVAALSRLIDIFGLNADNKGIAMNTCGLEDTFLTWLDEDKIDKIVGNLLSNALKFTPAGGRIDVCFDVVARDAVAECFSLTDSDRYTHYVKVSVANTGTAIPEDKLERIFERYYQIEVNAGGACQGTGIGLYYARSLAELHHGHIRAMVPPDGKGALFVLVLPVGDEAYPPEERDTEPVVQSDLFPLAAVEHSANEDSSDNRRTVMVVDDDTEVAHYLQTLLSVDYRVVCRFDADNALAAIREEIPDLVISDVVMPGKDGYELCREIKTDMQLCHIPVILVTAQFSVESQVEGLDTGANAYVTKPFDPNYLLALIRSQIKNREYVRNILNSATQTDHIAEDVLPPQDSAFMAELYALMSSELSNSELDIARMTEMLKMSRTKFYYKVKGLTGQNPSIFFRTYKLNRAAELLVEGRYTISEIADITGFSTLSHFSKSFKKQFGVAPSDYHKK